MFLVAFACFLCIAGIIGHEAAPILRDYYFKDETFTVLASGASGAEMRLCGKSVELGRSGDTLTASQKIGCESDGGEIAVSFPDRPPVICRLGSVAHGYGEEYRFTVQGNRCEFLGSEARP